MNIDLWDRVVPYFKPYVTPEMGEAVAKTVASGWLTTGKKVKELESEFQKMFPSKQVLMTNSATAASLIAFDALDLRWSEVITTPYTFSSPAMMLHHLGAKLVMVDIDPNTFNIDPHKVLDAVNPNTKAILLTHFGGRACDLTSIYEIASQCNLKVIEDCAHALPARYKGRTVGDMEADASFFSFYANKTMTTGEGGMLLLKDGAVAEHARKLLLHGFSTDAYDRYTNSGASWFYDVGVAGWKANMTDVAATLGLEQLRYLYSMSDDRTRVAEMYTLALKSLELHCPRFTYDSAWHVYPILVDAAYRDAFIESMKEKGVHCSVHFRPINQHSFWKEVLPRHSTPVSDSVGARVVSLPIYPNMPMDNVTYVVRAVTATLKEFV